MYQTLLRTMIHDVGTTIYNATSVTVSRVLTGADWAVSPLAFYFPIHPVVPVQTYFWFLSLFQ